MGLISRIWGFILKIFEPILGPIINRLKKIPGLVILIKHFLPVLTILIVMVSVALIWEILENDKVTNLVSDISEGLPKVGEGQTTSGAPGGTSSNMEQAAKKIHEYVRTNGYTYSLDVLAQTDDELTQVHSLCCATFVYWAAKEAGYKVADAPIHGADRLATALVNNAGFIEITDGTHQAGDVLWYPGEHIEIAAGPGEEVYNCGGDISIRAENDISTSSRGTSNARVYRAPQ